MNNIANNLPQDIKIDDRDNRLMMRGVIEDYKSSMEGEFGDRGCMDEINDNGLKGSIEDQNIFYIKRDFKL